MHAAGRRLCCGADGHLRHVRSDRLRDEETLRWGLIMAGVIMVAVPTLALLVLGQRQLIRGLTAGAVKG